MSNKNFIDISSITGVKKVTYSTPCISCRRPFDGIGGICGECSYTSPTDMNEEYARLIANKLKYCGHNLISFHRSGLGSYWLGYVVVFNKKYPDDKITYAVHIHYSDKDPVHLRHVTNIHYISEIKPVDPIGTLLIYTEMNKL